MDIAQIVPLASTWGIGAGWWIVMAGFMVLCMAAMGGMMLGMMRHWTFGRWPSWPDWPGRRRETPTDVLERRFAEGQISVEEYRDRREVLTGRTRPGLDEDEREPRVVPATTGKEES